jgi:uncharacterized membrane protein HdeD (DUF308 family)
MLNLRQALANHWWVFVLRGLVALIFGVIAWTRPGLTLASLVLLFGAYAIVDGIVGLVVGVKGRMGSLVLASILSAIAGVITFAWPGVTAFVLLYLIAFWAIVRGIGEISSAVALRKVIENEWLLGLAGLASVLFGLLLIFRPGAGALSVIWLIGTFAVAIGILLIGVGLRVKKLATPAAPSWCGPVRFNP